MVLLRWMCRRKKRKWRELLLWAMGIFIFIKANFSRGCCWAGCNRPQVEDLVYMRKNRCLFWMFHGNILNIEEMENWNRLQNSVFSLQIWYVRSSQTPPISWSLGCKIYCLRNVRIKVMSTFFFFWSCTSQMNYLMYFILPLSSYLHTILKVHYLSERTSLPLAQMRI